MSSSFNELLSTHNVYLYMSQMLLDREQLRVVLNALTIADLYYKDPNRSVKGMHANPSPETIARRLKGIEVNGCIHTHELLRSYPCPV